jgi:hypothetical protein
LFSPVEQSRLPIELYETGEQAVLTNTRTWKLTAGMISPASGIHRPSYNGAPAIQTLNELNDGLLLLSVATLPCASTCAARRRIARLRIYETN